MTHPSEISTAHAVQVVTSLVKWYSPTKGYGFCVPEGGSEDIFIHFSILDIAGIRNLKEGDQITCEVTTGKNGLQATRIISLTPSKLAFSPSQPNRPQEKVAGVVKWVNRLKGYGFLQAHNKPEDIFVHVSLLHDLGVTFLNPGTPVIATVITGQRGLEAIALELA